jgi:hypothetical protein
MPASSFHQADPHELAGSLRALRRFTLERRAARSPLERCELCSVGLSVDHRHLLDLSSRALCCVCDACVLLFSNPGAGEGKYRLVPRRYLALPDFQMTEAQWDELMIPVDMAFLLRSTGPKPVMAYYPGPAGAMESLLDLAGWTALAQSNPLLNDLEPDVEALLINRVQGAREYFIVPIDACYQLIGLIRLNWRGLSGGETVWQEIQEFFAALKAKATFVKGADNARPEL